MRAPFLVWVFRLALILVLGFQAWLHHERSRLHPGITSVEVAIWIGCLGAICGAFIRRRVALLLSVAVFVLQMLWLSVCWNLGFRMDLLEWFSFLVLEMVLPVWLAWGLLRSRKALDYFA
jgi:hypothetical protein